MLLKKASELHELLFREIGESQKTFFEHANREDTKLILLEEEPGILQGYAFVKVLFNEILISWLGIAPEFRNRGSGTKLLLKILDRFRKEGKARVHCFSRNRYKSAMRLYLRHDFNIIGTFKGMDGDLMIKFEKIL